MVRTTPMALVLLLKHTLFLNLMQGLLGQCASFYINGVESVAPGPACFLCRNRSAANDFSFLSPPVPLLFLACSYAHAQIIVITSPKCKQHKQEVAHLKSQKTMEIRLHSTPSCCNVRACCSGLCVLRDWLSRNPMRVSKSKEGSSS